MIQKVEILMDFSFRLSVSKCGDLKCLPPFVDVGLFDWGLKCLPQFVGIGLLDWGLKCLVGRTWDCDVAAMECTLCSWVWSLSLSLSLSRTSSFGSIKARSPSASNNQAKQTHITCNEILTETDLRAGSKSLCCRVGLLFHCFPS